MEDADFTSFKGEIITMTLTGLEALVLKQMFILYLHV